jgi:hypothetical protein
MVRYEADLIRALITFGTRWPLSIAASPTDKPDTAHELTGAGSAPPLQGCRFGAGADCTTTIGREVNPSADAANGALRTAPASAEANKAIANMQTTTLYMAAETAAPRGRDAAFPMWRPCFMRCI